MANMFAKNNPFLFGPGIDYESEKRAIRRYYLEAGNNHHFIVVERYFGISDALSIIEREFNHESEPIVWYPFPPRDIPEYFYPSDIKTLLKKIKELESGNNKDMGVLRKLYEHKRAILRSLYLNDKSPQRVLDKNTIAVIEHEVFGQKRFDWEFSSHPVGNDPSSPASLIPFPWEGLQSTNWLLSLLFKICSVCKFLE